MRYAVNAEEMKRIDQYTVEKTKIPAVLLMERAAIEVTIAMKQVIQKQDRILAVCGMGNNGGDGIAAGRILYLQGYQVAILFVGDEKKVTEQTKLQLEIARNLDIPMEHVNHLAEYNVIIDAVFGVGLSRPVTGEYAELITGINKARCSSDILWEQNRRRVFAVDIPSGISADDGSAMNIAVRADMTITFGYHKLGLLLHPGADYAGEVIVADIGFPKVAERSVQPGAFYYEQKDLKRIPARHNYSNKGTYGKVLIIGGSKGMSGAPCLSARAAYKTGVGLVKILTSYENRNIMQTVIPEALFAAHDDICLTPEERRKRISESLNWATVIVIGPGLGNSESARELLFQVIREAKVPVILDADGLNILAKEMDDRGLTGKDRLAYLDLFLKEGTIVTPHMLELSRLLGVDLNEISRHLIDTAAVCSSHSKLVYAIKDARTVVTIQEKLYLNTSGNHGMATGGSGDVLTGVIAALIAQGMSPDEAACLGVYLHGTAGDAAAKEKGAYSMMAGDIVNAIEIILKNVVNL